MTPEQNEVPPVLAEPSQHVETPHLERRRSYADVPAAEISPEFVTLLRQHGASERLLERAGESAAPDPDATVAIVFGRHRQDGTRGTRPASPPPPRRWIGRVAAALIPRLRRRAEQEEVA